MPVPGPDTRPGLDGSAGFDRLDVLVIEDDEVDRLAIRRSLSRSGLDARIEDAGNLAEARSRLAARHFDLAFLDNRLPDGSGSDILGWMQAAGVRLPVIVLTGQGDEQTAVSLMKAGAADYLAKSDLDAAALASRVPAVVRMFRAEQALRDADERMRLAVEAASVGIFELEPTTGRLAWTARCRELFGTPDAPEATSHDALIAGVLDEDRESLEEALARAVDPQGSGEYEAEFRVGLPDGRRRWLGARGRTTFVGLGATRRATRLLGAVLDLTERKESEQRLRHESLHDGLTGLPNRVFFRAELERIGEVGRREGRRHQAVLFIDLDRFKVVNDSLGHQAGDDLLREVAARLRASVRPEDFVARLGGDEFTVLMRSLTSLDEAREVAERILAALEKPMHVGGSEVVTTASIGVAALGEGVGDADAVLRDADLAMYRAKERGRARIQLFEDELRDAAVRRLGVENELRHALRHDQIEPHFQPIVALADGTVRGFEALARWRHDRRGLLLPDSFLDVAEETGLVLELGRTLLARACTAAATWLDGAREAGDGAPFVAVNLSAREIAEGGLRASVEDALEASGLHPSRLHLQVAETVLWEADDATLGRLRSLREAGVRLAVDGFGTGLGALGRLRSLPVDVVEVDRSLVAEIRSEPTVEALVQGVLAVARRLGATVAAEGIENDDQRRVLRELGCELAQGKLFGDAVPAAEIERHAVTTRG